MNWGEITHWAVVALALILAALLAYNEKSGWGWFIFIAFIAI